MQFKSHNNCRIVIIILNLKSNHGMDKMYCTLEDAYKNNTLFRSYHIVMHVYSKIKYINIYTTAVRIDQILE